MKQNDKATFVFPSSRVRGGHFTAFSGEKNKFSKHGSQWKKSQNIDGYYTNPSGAWDHDDVFFKLFAVWSSY